MWIIDMNFKLLFGKRANIVKAIYYIANMFLSILLLFQPIMTYNKMVGLCFFPYTQITNFSTLAIKCLNSGTTASFGNFSEPLLADFSFADLFIFTGIMFLLLGLLFIYLVPLKLANDEENPLKWYYPCVCGCLRKRRKKINFV